LRGNIKTVNTTAKKSFGASRDAVYNHTASRDAVYKESFARERHKGKSAEFYAIDLAD
jgi:hypothetical protein